MSLYRLAGHKAVHMARIFMFTEGDIATVAGSRRTTQVLNKTDSNVLHNQLSLISSSLKMKAAGFSKTSVAI